MPKMRAKMRVGAIMPLGNDQEALTMFGVAKNGSYAADGSDEDNTFAKFSPSAEFRLHLANPALVGTFTIGDTFYVDFTPVE